MTVSLPAVCLLIIFLVARAVVSRWFGAKLSDPGWLYTRTARHFTLQLQNIRKFQKQRAYSRAHPHRRVLPLHTSRTSILATLKRVNLDLLESLAVLAAVAIPSASSVLSMSSESSHDSSTTPGYLPPGDAWAVLNDLGSHPERYVLSMSPEPSPTLSDAPETPNINPQTLAQALVTINLALFQLATILRSPLNAAELEELRNPLRTLFSSENLCLLLESEVLVRPVLALVCDAVFYLDEDFGAENLVKLTTVLVPLTPTDLGVSSGDTVCIDPDMYATGVLDGTIAHITYTVRMLFAAANRFPDAIDVLLDIIEGRDNPTALVLLCMGYRRALPGHVGARIADLLRSHLQRSPEELGLTMHFLATKFGQDLAA